MSLEEQLGAIVEQNTTIISHLELLIDTVRQGQTGASASSVEVEELASGKRKFTIKAYAPRGGQPTLVQLREALAAAELVYRAAKRNDAAGMTLDPTPDNLLGKHRDPALDQDLTPALEASLAQVAARQGDAELQRIADEEPAIAAIVGSSSDTQVASDGSHDEGEPARSGPFTGDYPLEELPDFGGELPSQRLADDQPREADAHGRDSRRRR